jgi:hypothetical protein
VDISAHGWVSCSGHINDARSLFLYIFVLFNSYKIISTSKMVLALCLQNSIYYLTLILLFLHTMECLCLGLFLYECMSFDSACVCLT